MAQPSPSSTPGPQEGENWLPQAVCPPTSTHTQTCRHRDRQTQRINATFSKGKKYSIRQISVLLCWVLLCVCFKVLCCVVSVMLCVLLHLVCEIRSCYVDQSGLPRARITDTCSHAKPFIQQYIL